MSGISNFILSFCTVSVCIGALFILTPKGNLSKSVKYIFSLAFICCLIPCISLFKGFTVNTDTSYIFKEDNTSSLVKTVITQSFEEALTKSGINFSKIYVLTDKTEDDSIIINEVIIFSDESIEKIKTVLGDMKDIKVSVISE